MDVVNLKISKLGGLTQTAQARDLCVSMGIAMTLEDSWGGDIATAAIAHLAHSTPTEFLFTTHRLQQLRHGHDRRRRAAASERAHGRVDGAGTRHRAAHGRPRPAGRRRRVRRSSNPHRSPTGTSSAPLGHEQNCSLMTVDRHLCLRRPLGRFPPRVEMPDRISKWPPRRLESRQKCSNWNAVRHKCSFSAGPFPGRNARGAWILSCYDASTQRGSEFSKRGLVFEVCE